MKKTPSFVLAFRFELATVYVILPHDILFIIVLNITSVYLFHSCLFDFKKMLLHLERCSSLSNYTCGEGVISLKSILVGKISLTRSRSLRELVDWEKNKNTYKGPRRHPVPKSNRLCTLWVFRSPSAVQPSPLLCFMQAMPLLKVFANRITDCTFKFFYIKCKTTLSENHK